MKAQKIDDIKFAIKQEYPDINIDITRKKGEIFLSISDIFFREGDKWYEIPLTKLEDIKIINKDIPELEFTIPALKVRVEGEYAEKLLALRHLLLPYIRREGKVREDPMKSILKLWALGLQKKKAIADLLNMDEEDVSHYISIARSKGLIEDNELTDEGRELLEEEEIGSSDQER